MKRRLDALKRLGRLQAQMHELAKWRLAALQRRQEELAQAHGGMIEAMGRDLASYGPLAAAVTRRVRAIERSIDAGAIECDAQVQQVFDRGAKAKLAESAIDAATASFRSQAERKELSELIERSLGRSPSSSG